MLPDLRQWCLPGYVLRVYADGGAQAQCLLLVMLMNTARLTWTSWYNSLDRCLCAVRLRDPLTECCRGDIGCVRHPVATLVCSPCRLSTITAHGWTTASGAATTATTSSSSSPSPSTCWAYSARACSTSSTTAASCLNRGPLSRILGMSPGVPPVDTTTTVFLSPV